MTLRIGMKGVGGGLAALLTVATSLAAETTTRTVQQTQTIVAPGAPAGRLFSALLVEPEKLARQRAATVQVTAPHVQLMEPTQTAGLAQAGQGHLHYRVDGGPIIDTAIPVLSFQALAPGAHTIAVELAGNDHRPLGPTQVLAITVPDSAVGP